MARDFRWWSETFKNVIKEIGRFVMVLEPWKNPVPLNRGWCIWELYCVIDCKVDVGVAMSKASEQQFICDVNKCPEDFTDRMQSSIDCQNCQTSRKSDEIRIHAAIERITLGF